MPLVFDTTALKLSAGGMGLLVICIIGVAILAVLARRELGAELDRRKTLFDAAAGLLDDARLTICSDGYPRLEGRCGGDRVRLEIVSDSLVPRRLPQLWLRSTLIAREERSGPSIGVLARPAGTEFYSRVLGLPDALTPTFAADFPMLMRGGGATEETLRTTSALFRTLFADPTLKEAVITPRGSGVVRQIAEGDRGAHILYRQMRFPVSQVPPDLVRNALGELRMLNEALKPAPRMILEPA